MDAVRVLEEPMLAGIEPDNELFVRDLRD